MNNTAAVQHIITRRRW